MKAKVFKYRSDGNTVVAPYMELEPYAENVYLSLSRKNEYGINDFATLTPRKRLIFRGVKVGLASTLLMNKVAFYRGIKAFRHFRITFSYQSHSERKP